MAKLLSLEFNCRSTPCARILGKYFEQSPGIFPLCNRALTFAQSNGLRRLNLGLHLVLGSR
jgi:hypothetical protein